MKGTNIITISKVTKEKFKDKLKGKHIENHKISLPPRLKQIKLIDKHLMKAMLWKPFSIEGKLDLKTQHIYPLIV